MATEGMTTPRGQGADLGESAPVAEAEALDLFVADGLAGDVAAEARQCLKHLLLPRGRHRLRTLLSQAVFYCVLCMYTSCSECPLQIM